ncbi:class II D-tagatose-bisphosphate aldolase, non-catalytic subunit [Abyssibius alkaniclasticus]|uniref:class II D-tagatose-bisphosphate aldolase non-catalytic subunit n=1 Tax=Abyssibius alkaniclasticus TaxID=2881234 RepID=UPI0023635636|nr:class II D-tagatose-bisphosphate aldolase, non-catalytic subunit [Abyssibius alkaniclasticus]UPH72231.1 class II D-tagatose-bisphosphate aldolase, non-catalytic subunit [Abyssibius alkaniclasticus]
MFTKAPPSSAGFARAVFAANLAGAPMGLTAVCSAHPLVLRAALAAARESGQIALIEATCNQVNQDGGYTGMQPADFVARVRGIAAEIGLPADRLLLGGDHLGPQPWRNLPAADAMKNAVTMVTAYVLAGFQKIHLDCSMRCAGDPEILPEAICAERAATLAQAAEAALPESAPRPIYVIGTEVPPPGGMGAGHKIVPTDPAHVGATWRAHKDAFAALGLEAAFARVCGIVVQPGLDFGNESVVHFAPDAARGLTSKAASLNGAVYEAHSTDYQRPEAYAALVRGHFAILKVGPAATFALREGLYALDMLAGEILGRKAPKLRSVLETEMLANPAHWQGHYSGDADHVAWLRHFSWSDRIRYYWTAPAVERVLEALFEALDACYWPQPLLSQYLPHDVDDLASGRARPRCADIVTRYVRRALAPYYAASDPHLTLEKEC